MSVLIQSFQTQDSGQACERQDLSIYLVKMKCDHFKSKTETHCIISDKSGMLSAKGQKAEHCLIDQLEPGHKCYA